MYKESGLDKETLVDSLFDHYNEIVPVIGEDMFVYKGEFSDGKELSIREYLLIRFQEDFNIRLDDDKINAILKHDYYGLSIMHRIFDAKGKDYIAKYKKYILEAETRNEISLKPYVLDFLQAFNFSLIITTVSFRFLENILSRKDVSYSSVGYKLNGNNKNPLPIGKNIYHIFGDAKDGYDWVYDEKMLLGFMHSLHEKDYMAENLIKYMRNGKKRMMVLGCNMPDWLFRFLWFPIYSDYSFEGDNGYWINETDVEDSFDSFLQEVNYASNEEVRYILETITSKFKSLITDTKEKKPKKDRFDVFISYSSNDFELVKIIYKILSDRNIDAWFDEDGSGRIIEGENYMKKIKENVPKCKYYMPIVTETFIQKSLDVESNLSKETAIIDDYYKTLAEEDKDAYSLPVIIAGNVFNGNDIDTKLVEGLSSLGILKKHFYYQKKMMTFDVENQENFIYLDWEKIIQKSK